jgi:nitrite reductase/ring-hydroxylating ferredoxin subunit
MRVWVGGVQVALFNLPPGRLVATGPGCTHIGGPLAGQIDTNPLEGAIATCSDQACLSKFDVTTGTPQGGPATVPLVCFGVTAKNGLLTFTTR